MFLILFSACKTYAPLPSNVNASRNTKKAYQALKDNAKRGVMFGYEDAMAYGIGWKETEDSCDMYRVTQEWPAIYGWDLGDIHSDYNLDHVSFAKMIFWMKKVNKMGGINTLSWHLDDPGTGNDSWTKESVVEHLIPGGQYHNLYKERLDMAAVFLKQLNFPVIWRPFHEHNGDWFWWGKGNATEKDYITLYRFTADYFRVQHKLNNLIYAFSPDRGRLPDCENVADYLYGYPGDDYVDIIGLDDYHDMKSSENEQENQKHMDEYRRAVEMIVDLAEKKGKVAAVTETGLDKLDNENWFTQRLWGPLANSEKAQKIAYIQVWRNRDTDHFYVPYPGHKTANDFKEFIKNEKILTLKDIK